MGTMLLELLLLGSSVVGPQDDLIRTGTFGGRGRPNPFEEMPDPRAVLVGLKAAADGSGRFVQSVQPVYRRGKSIVEGKIYGPRPRDGVYLSLVAKEGYAVGGISGRAGAWIDGFSLIFMRIRGESLEPADAYESPHVGGQGGNPQEPVNSQGAFIVGVYGGTGAYVDCFGFILAKKGKPDRLEPPSPTAMKEAENLVKELFKEGYAKRDPADRRAFAARLLTQARETKGEDAVRFVLLRESRNMAVLGEDLQTALAAAEETARIFLVDELELKGQVVGTAAKAAKRPEMAKKVAETGLGLADEALGADKYETAMELASKAESAARTAKDLGSLRRAQDKREEIEEARKDHARAKAAEKVLEENREDPEANLALGKYLALVKGDWGKGLPLLAKGADPILKDAAGKDLGNPTECKERAEAGDLWWEIGEKEKRGVIRERLRDRARQWYERALGGLAGINKARVEKRLLESGAQGLTAANRDRPKKAEQALGFALRRHPDDAVGFGGHYYKLFDATTGWKEARKRCQGMGGYLACVTDEAEFQFVMSLLQGKGSGPDCCWVGATDEAAEGRWEWITGEPFSWKNIDAGENRGENCLNIRISAKRFEDYPDRGEFVGKQMFLCEWEL